MKYTIEPSSRAAKKYMVTTADGKVIHFGGAGYDDYTTHKDEKRKARYLSRTASQPLKRYYLSSLLGSLGSLE